MSGSASQVLEQQLLQHSLAIAPMLAPARVYVALCRTLPSEATGGTEVGAGGYTRSAATFSMLSATNAANAGTVEFPVATAAWGTVGFFEVWTAATGGDRLYWGPLVDADGITPVSLNIVAGDIVRLPVGTLSIQVAEQPAVSGGAYMVIATGSTTPRSMQDREARVRNALDYGCVNDGVFDNGPAIRALIPLGGAIYFPKGRYLFNGSYAVVPSNTRIFGDGPGQTVFIAQTLTGGVVDPTFSYMFINNNYSLYGAFDTTPNASHAPYDVNITFEDLSVEVVGHIGAICRFRWAQDVNILNVRSGTTVPTGQRIYSCAFAFLGCDRVLVDNFHAYDVMNALDCWKGNTHFKFTNLVIEQMQDGGNGGAINWQGVGTVNDGEIGDELVISNATFILHNGIALFLDSFSAGSITRNLFLSNIRITQVSGTGGAIIARGLVDKLIIRGMTVTALSGANIGVINIGGYFDGTPSKQTTNMITTTNGSADVVVDFPCDCGVGNYLAISDGAAGPVIGNGVTLNGYYKIKSISGTVAGDTGRFYTITAAMPATSTGPIAAMTRATGYLGAPTNCIVEDVVIEGCGNGGGPLIRITGHGHYVDGIVVRQSYGASPTPLYNTVVSVDADPAHPATMLPCFVGNIVAEPGVGAVPAGYSGDNIIQRAIGIPQPSGNTWSQPVGTDNNAVATTAFATRMLGRTSPTLSDANTTFTSAETGTFYINIIGTLTAQRYVSIPTTGRQQVWAIRNGTTGGFPIGVNGSPSGGPATWIAPGLTQLFWTDGTNMNTLPTQVSQLRIGGTDRNALVVTPNATVSLPITIGASYSGGIQFTSNVGFNSATPLAKPTLSGAWAGNTAGKALATILANYGLITDSSTA
jgi:hypothetical protein